MRVYCIPGIGADDRLFHKLQLPDGFQKIPLNWLATQPGESLQAYAQRMAAAITCSEESVLLGVSLGGIIALEIARITGIEKVILVSSIADSMELPPYFRVAGQLRLHKVIHPSVYTSLTQLRNAIFTRNSADRNLVQTLAGEADESFIRWAVQAVLDWTNAHRPPKLIRIHGSRDIVFPLRYVRADHVLDGGHLLVLHQHRAVNGLLAALLPEFGQTQSNSTAVRSGFEATNPL